MTCDKHYLRCAAFRLRYGRAAGDLIEYLMIHISNPRGKGHDRQRRGTLGLVVDQHEYAAAAVHDAPNDGSISERIASSGSTTR